MQNRRHHHSRRARHLTVSKGLALSFLVCQRLAVTYVGLENSDVGWHCRIGRRACGLRRAGRSGWADGGLWREGPHGVGRDEKGSSVVVSVGPGIVSWRIATKNALRVREFATGDELAGMATMQLFEPCFCARAGSGVMATWLQSPADCRYADETNSGMVQPYQDPSKWGWVSGVCIRADSLRLCQG